VPVLAPNPDDATATDGQTDGRTDAGAAYASDHQFIYTHTYTHALDCAVGTTDRFLSAVSPFMCVESNSAVADPGAAAARPCTRVVKWLCAELPDCSSMFES